MWLGFPSRESLTVRPEAMGQSDLGRKVVSKLSRFPSPPPRESRPFRMRGLYCARQGLSVIPVTGKQSGASFFLQALYRLSAFVR